MSKVRWNEFWWYSDTMESFQTQKQKQVVIFYSIKVQGSPQNTT